MLINLSGQQQKYKGKYRIPSARLQTWDYGWNGAYFITICTKNRIHYFGDIVERSHSSSLSKKMRLSHIGILADVFWYEIKNHTDNIELGDFVVMPNHVHGILRLNKNDGDDNNHNHEYRRDKACLVSTPCLVSTTISSIIGGYKSAVTKHARRLGYEFAWKSRFYDHIIRHDESYNRITEYIINNPQNWQEDKFYTGEQLQNT